MIIADTGFWVALFNPRDTHHHAVRTQIVTINESLITTLPVITEVCYLLQKHRSQAAAVTFLTKQRAGLFNLFHLQETHLSRMAQLMAQYADLPMDLADASLVLLAEELGHGRIVSTDRRDFQTYRWKNHQPFTNLLENFL